MYGEIADLYKGAEKITLVMDNLGTHKPGALYETFKPEKAKQIWDKVCILHFDCFVSRKKVLPDSYFWAFTQRYKKSEERLNFGKAVKF